MLLTRHYDQRPFDETVCDALITNCDVSDEIPPQAIIRMGVGYILPIEEPLVAEGEGQCSTQVEPSPTQDPHASEEQSEGPQPNEQALLQDAANATLRSETL